MSSRSTRRPMKLRDSNRDLRSSSSSGPKSSSPGFCHPRPHALSISAADPALTPSGSASLGYEVHLVDATPRLLDLARRREGGNGRLASIGHGDARRLTFSDAAFDAALLLGPLYHLTSRSDRLAALAEAARILRPRGVLMAAGISRYAGTLDGLAFHPPPTSDVLEMRHRALTDGQYGTTPAISATSSRRTSTVRRISPRNSRRADSARSVSWGSRGRAGWSPILRRDGPTRPRAHTC